MCTSAPKWPSPLRETLFGLNFSSSASRDVPSNSGGPSRKSMRRHDNSTRLSKCCRRSQYSTSIWGELTVAKRIMLQRQRDFPGQTPPGTGCAGPRPTHGCRAHTSETQRRRWQGSGYWREPREQNTRRLVKLAWRIAMPVVGRCAPGNRDTITQQRSPVWKRKGREFHHRLYRKTC